MFGRNNHVAVLRQGAAVWNRWRQANENHVIDLRGVDLSHSILTGVNLARCNLHGASLSHADLEGAEFQHSDLVRAKLFQANLRGTNFHGANLRSAFLGKANLDAADLRNANLQGTNLQGAILRNANLEFSVFIRSDVRGCDFRKAKCGGTTFSQIRLSEARHLDAVLHSRASSLGIEILTTSGAELPLSFLRGCGIEDDVLALVGADRTNQVERFYSVYISYSRKDSQFASRLHDKLQAIGVRCWLDQKRMRPGEDIYEAVDQGIRDHDRILLCASKSSLSSWWVDAEIEAAFAKERELMEFTQTQTPVLIPIDLDGYMFSEHWRSGKRRLVQSRLAADFTEPERFDEEFRRLRRTLTRQSPDVPPSHGQGGENPRK